MRWLGQLTNFDKTHECDQFCDHPGCKNMHFDAISCRLTILETLLYRRESASTALLQQRYEESLAASTFLLTVI